MADERGLLAALLEKMRVDSAETRLSPATELASLVPEGDISVFLEENAEDDIKLMRDSRDRYYISERSMTGNPAYADTCATAASNGDRYLYSTQYLTEAYAAGLAEWASVGEKENP